LFYKLTFANDAILDYHTASTKTIYITKMLDFQISNHWNSVQQHQTMK